VNILILNSIGKKKWGGGEKWMILVSKGLKERGHNVTIGCKKGSLLEKNAHINNIETVNININSDISAIGAFQLIRFGKKNRIDTIIACQNRDVRISGFVRRLIGNPVLLSRQGVQLINRSWKYKCTFKWLCDGIITNTETIKKEYDSYGWWDQDYVKVIHNGVEEPKDSHQRFDYRKYIPASIESPQIIFSAGRFSHQKGFEYLVAAAKELCAQRDDLFFFVAGQGKLERKIKHQIIESGLKNRFFLLGFQTDLAPFLKGADLFVLSSLHEGMPNVVMEAMVHKIPVIATKVNGVEELIRQGIDGIIVDPASSNQLAKAIDLYFVEKKGIQLAQSAYERIKTEFSVNTMVNNLENHLLTLNKKPQLKSCLIIQTAFIGDVILATSLIENIKLQHPDCQIDFLLRKGNEGLLTNHPKVRNTLVFDKTKGKYKNLITLIKKIRGNKYELVVNVQRYSTTGIITTLSGAKTTVGFAKNPLSRFFTYKIAHYMGNGQAQPHEVERNHKLIERWVNHSTSKPRLYPTKDDFDAVKTTIPYFCLAPTSVWYTKQFPIENWIKLINELPHDHQVYLLGGGGDRSICESITTKTTHPLVLNKAGELSFLKSAALMAHAKMNFVNDSAPLHICSAMNAPVRALFCSTVPAFGYTPLSDDSMVIETDHQLDCRPCGLHGKKNCPQGHFKCGDISTQKITRLSNISN
jgi:heptosyltransferase-2